MASIRRHPNAKSRWQVRYRDPSGKQRTRNFAKKVEAERYANLVEADKLRGDWTDPRLSRRTFADWVHEYQDHRGGVRESTALRDETYFRTTILPTFGSLQLRFITRASIERWIGDLSEQRYAPATIRKAFQLLAASLEAASSEGLIPRSPADMTAQQKRALLPRIERGEMRFLTEDEIQLVAAASPPRCGALVLTAAYTGLRWGELAALKVGHQGLNLLGRKISVTSTLMEVGGRLRLGPPKTASAFRSVSLPRFLTDILARHIEQHPADDALVFSSPEGGPLRRTNFRRRIWLPTVEDSVGPPLRFHDLRHSHAALLIAQGVHPKVIQVRLGHASIATTLDTYGHLFAGLDEAAAERLDEAYPGPRVDRLWTDELPAAIRSAR